MRAVGHGIGQPVRRKEDWRLLTGHGCYVDGAGEPGACGDRGLAACARAACLGRYEGGSHAAPAHKFTRTSRT